MVAGERKSEIMQALERDRKVQAGELAARFGVSEDTIRRDLRSLADAGLVRRIYGGAVPQTPVSTTFTGRVGESVEVKQRIVNEALTFVKPGQTLFLDGGTTVAALARSLPRDIPLTVVTHSPPAASALIDNPFAEVIVLGGRLLRDAAVTVGSQVIDGYSRCRADICFMGVASVHAELGLGVFFHDDAEVKRAMMIAASEVVVLASADKIGTKAPFLIGPVSSAHCIITASTAAIEHLEPIRRVCEQVITV